MILKLFRENREFIFGVKRMTLFQRVLVTFKWVMLWHLSLLRPSVPKRGNHFTPSTRRPSWSASKRFEFFIFCFMNLKFEGIYCNRDQTRDHLVECIFDAIAIELCSALCLYGFVAQIMGTATTHKCTRTTLSLRNHTQTWLTSKRLLFLHFRRWLGGRWRPFKNLVSIWTAVTFIRPISCEQ